MYNNYALQICAHKTCDSNDKGQNTRPRKKLYFHVEVV